ncbi:MAG: virulence RhuM family protein [Bacteroidetes bacterium]|nr:virulence RhuM family protein [Bacteroidota bacterium]
MKKQPEISIRSSAAEYLTFVAATGDNPQSVEMRYEDENIWLTQKMLATLYDITVQGIGQHIKKVLEDKELSEGATVKKFFIVQNEGNRQVSREIEHYNLQMIIAVGFKVNNDRAVQFRKWANAIVKDYTIKGWVMDVERLKNGGSILTEKYFEEQLEKIREIRISERKFYQKITDLYATALDYDITAKTTKTFFATVQNKLHFAIHGNTAAELITQRANHTKPFMGLTSWKGFPDGKIQKYDVAIAKNYLEIEELDNLQRIVTMYLDYAEYQTLRKIPMTMEDWKKRLDAFLKFNEEEILTDAGKITHEIAKSFAESEFEKYRIIQDQLFESDYDKFIRLETQVKQLKND